MLNVDMFSSPINLTFNKQQKYSTKCGTFASLLILVTLAVYLYILLTQPLVESAQNTISTTFESQAPIIEVGQEAGQTIRYKILQILLKFAYITSKTTSKLPICIYTYKKL